MDSPSLLPAGLPADPALLPTLLDLLPMGVIYYTPVLDGAGTLTDLTLAYLNPAAQRMTRLPARPESTYRQRFPTTDDNGAWDFHHRSWLSGEPQEFQFYYDADGFDSYFRVVARRLGEGLLVVFTDTRNERRSEMEQALRDSQARERAALARAEATQREAEVAHADLANVFTQAPAMICIFEGPAHTFQFVNPPYQALVGERPLLGRPIADAMPELAGQPIFGLLDQVYRTGETFAANEMLVQLDHHNEGRPELEKRYYNFIYKARHDRQGVIDGVLVFAYEVTPQVLTREQVQTLNEELAAINEELRATNEEHQRANLALSESQQQLQQLTQELEARVQERTRAAGQAQAGAEQERQSVVELIAQAPAALCIVAGPDFVYETFNPLYAAMFGGRPRVGRPMGEVLPEVVNHPGFLGLRAVYAEGRINRQREMLVPLARPDDGVLENRYFDYTQQPRYTSEGQIDGVFVFAVEVTEQVRARQQVEQLNAELEARVQERTGQVETARAEVESERALLQAVLTQAPIAIGLYTGQDLRVVAASTLFTDWLGHSHAQVLGRPLLESAPELRGQGFDDLLRQVMATQEPFVGTEMMAVVRRSEELHTGYYSSVYQPLYAGDRQVIGVMSVAVEVTEQVRARQQVEQLNAELEVRVRERTHQLSAQQALLGRILGQVPASVATLEGPEHRFSFFNEQYQQLVDQRAALGVSVAEAFPEATEQGFVALLDQVYQTGQPFVGSEIFIQLRPPNGPAAEHYLNFVYQPLRDDQGQVSGILAFVVEVTEQVRARQQNEALQAELLVATQRQARARESFYQVFEQTPAAVSLLRGPTHRFEYVNPVYQQVFAGRQLVGRDFAEALPDAATQGFLALLDGVYSTGETFFGAEVPFLSEPADAPAYTTYFTFTYQAYRENGEITGISTFALDVTEQVRARQEREAQRGELQRLFEQAPVAIAVFRGPQYVIELANSSVCALWGRTPAQALGTPLFELLPEVAGQGFEELLDQVRTTGEPFVAHELPSFIDRHGRRDTVYWNFVYAPLREADGRIERVTVVATEGTEQVLARQQTQALNARLTATNEELNESNTQLTRTNVDLDNFIYTASHDLKAPITNIEGLLLALEHELPEAARSGDVSLMLTMMQDAIERFQRTITHLTDLSRLQKEHNPASDAVLLAPVVEAVRLDLTPLLAHTDGQLTASIPDGLLVTFAEKNLRSVVYNLLSNAFKYHHPDRLPAVQLRSWLADGYTVLEVQDNGLGLDLSRGQEQLFGMFQRLHTHVEGTGVGLYMVKRIVENAGGRIEVSSELGEGTTFQVFFRR